MIFAVSGTQRFQFDRLFKAIDNLVERGIITDEIFAQIGNSNYIPRNFKYERFLSMQAFDSCIDNANLIVAHSGGGVTVTSLKKGKRIVIVPRLAKFGEHVDDHQLEIANVFGELNLLEVCYDVENLEMAIENAKSKTFTKYESKLPKISDIIEGYLEGKC
jgi:UDP-N-acetylglucosamine transferase subunit ALG13